MYPDKPMTKKLCAWHSVEPKNGVRTGPASPGGMASLRLVLGLSWLLSVSVARLSSRFRATKYI